MSFAWPHMFWLLFVPALLLWWELTHQRRAAASVRPKILRAEAGARSLKLSASGDHLPSSAKPRLWLCAGLVLAIVALARPQWGRIEEPVFDQSREILLAVDLSRSMLAQDIKPSRLERAKLLIQALLEKLAGERVGLVVFSGTAFLQSPLSADYEILREFLPSLGPDFLPEGGSNYGALLDTALQAFGSSGSADRFLVVLGDGEATDEGWREHIEQLKKKDIRVIGLGVGTSGGAMIPDGSGGFVKDERGAVVLSKLESSTLQALAQATNGVYRDAGGWVDVAALVNETIAAGRKGQFVEKNTVRLVERFQWPLAFGLWCLLVSFCYEFPVRPRVRDVKLATSDKTGDRKPETEKLTTTTVSLVVIAAVALLYPVSGFAAAQLAHPSAATKAPSTTPADEPPALAKIVGRLSTTDHRTAHDWAELGRETVNWGSRLQSEQHPVPEGPVRDALAAAELGEKLDSKATDWPKLREELEALLKKPDEDKQQQQQQQQKQQQNQQDKNQQKQDQKSSPQQQNQSQKENDQKKNESSSGEPEKKEEKKDGGESAFGDMTKKDQPPPPPPQNTQKVGGAGEKKNESNEPIDPTLAIPMQKLEQLRNQDSPAQLFQLMEPDKKPTKKTGKDW
jgi:Ca-activated chloride channel family protein